MGSLEKSELRNVVLMGGFQQVPPKKFCFMMLFLCGFPSDSFEKIHFMTLFLPGKNFGVVMVLLSEVINVC